MIGQLNTEFHLPDTLSVLESEVHLDTLVLQTENLAGDAAQVSLEGEQHVLHPLQDAITAGDLIVELSNVACLADVVIYGHLLSLYQLLLYLFRIVSQILTTLKNILHNVILKMIIKRVIIRMIHDLL